MLAAVVVAYDEVSVEKELLVVVTYVGKEVRRRAALKATAKAL